MAGISGNITKIQCSAQTAKGEGKSAIQTVTSEVYKGPGRRVVVT
jgi:hypothetical protein